MDISQIGTYIDLNMGAFIAGTTMGIVAAISQSGIKSRFKPITTLILGIIIGILAMGFTRTAILTGIVGPLIAMGFWSGTKATFKSENKSLSEIDYTSL